jgi:hypothetical protein
VMRMIEPPGPFLIICVAASWWYFMSLMSINLWKRLCRMFPPVS